MMNRGGGGLMGSIPPVTKNLLIITVLAFIAQVALESKGIALDGYLGLHFFLADGFMPYQLLTYMFMHGGLGHMFFNMFALFMFGRTLEMVWGGKRFLIYYLFTGVGAALIQEAVWTFTLWDYLGDPQIGAVGLLTVGASGGVFGILLAFGMLFPNAELIMIPIPIPIKAKYFMIGYGVLELTLGVANISGDPIAHSAHLGGLLFGLILILFWRKTGKSDGRFY